ncbi:broad-complex core protein isoforms 1/2/3/4/5-like [Anguilla anguilla]|uniref:broad-complex core protein isoforms 1/2/3/4/5-like n=1 Tax=Anguilla anguilla TaxID=7936 RepID=UPI0015AC6AF1|nr:broad-complex core protein isoforms 1/2/3/4/5-like [Anguilla anguilla]
MLAKVGMGLLVAVLMVHLVTESQGALTKASTPTTAATTTTATGNNNHNNNNGTGNSTGGAPHPTMLARPTSTAPRCPGWSTGATLALALSAVLL